MQALLASIRNAPGRWLLFTAIVVLFGGGVGYAWLTGAIGRPGVSVPVATRAGAYR